MDRSPDLVREDFDRIATAGVDDSAWNHNVHYHEFLLKQVPARARFALDAGCGTGAFARRLAARVSSVDAIDLSGASLAVARQRSPDHPNIRYVEGDLLAFPFDLDKYDFIASIATLHHVRLSRALPVLKAALRPGGVLAVLDLYEPSTPMDQIVSAIAVPVSKMMKLLRNGRLDEFPSDESRRAHEAHFTEDSYPTLRAVREQASIDLPGASLRRHLFWRYSLIWQRP